MVVAIPGGIWLMFFVDAREAADHDSGDDGKKWGCLGGAPKSSDH